MSLRTIVATDALAARLDDPSLAIVDCRFRLDDTGWGEREWAAAHVPGAVYAHLERDLSAPMTGRNGRHPLPDPAQLADTLGRLGIGNGTDVVAYDQDSGMFASRLWWLLRWVGHERVAILDGGFARWSGEGRPVDSGRTTREPAAFRASPRSDMTADAREVAARMGDPRWRLVDSRAPERYRGETEPIDPVAGHIPSAANHFFQWNLDERGAMRAPDDLRARFEALMAGAGPERTIFYCGSGVQAAQNLLALEHAGITGARLYPGSWSEWISDPERPVEPAPQQRTGS